MRTGIVACSVQVAKDFVSETFGNLNALGPVFIIRRDPGYSKRSNKVVRGRTDKVQVCQCICGAVDVYFRANLTKGKSTSCGCVRNHDTAIRSRSHGMRKDPHYAVWCSMRARCKNPNNDAYHNYGGRGIGVCLPWDAAKTGFVQWYTDMGPRPSPEYSIERKDNDGDYCPENCIWATVEEQANNKRPKYLTLSGRTQTLGEWEIEIGLTAKQIRKRKSLGWDDDRILTTPLKANKNRKPK